MGDEASLTHALTLDEYQQLAIRTAGEFREEPEKRLLIWSVAWAGEVGEFCAMAARSVTPRSPEEERLQEAARVTGLFGEFLNKLKKQVGHGHAISDQELARQLETAAQAMLELAAQLRGPEAQSLPGTDALPDQMDRLDRQNETETRKPLAQEDQGKDQGPGQTSTEQTLVDDRALLDEMGDGLWYPAAIAWLKGWRLSEPARHNVEKLRRRYPDGFSQERSINRTV